MAHIPYTATHQTAVPAVCRPTCIEPVQEAADDHTLEDELLARLDEWMDLCPVAASVLAGLSVAATVLVIAVALAASSI